MAKRKKLDAGIDEAEVVSADTIHENPMAVDGLPQMSGVVRDVAAGDQAQTIIELREQIEALKLNPAREKKMVVDAILAGRLSIQLHPSWLIDQVGTDRDDQLGNTQENPSAFEELKKDLKDNGQMQPIRVRVSADTPEVREALYLLANRMGVSEPSELSSTAPGDLHGRLFLQSGRRRTKACELNERPVLAFVSIDKSADTPAEAADLLERFRENALRSDLSGWEKIRSIAQIKNAMPGVSQHYLAEKLGVGRGDISVAVDAYELEADIEAMFGPGFRERGVRWFRSSVPAVKNWVAGGRQVASETGNEPEERQKPQPPAKVTATREKGRAILSNGLTVSAGRGGAIKVSLEDGSKPSQDQIEWILEAIAKGAGRVK